jgi:hypothetical protein
MVAAGDYQPKALNENMTMTSTETISSAWQCHALEPRGDAHGHRCEASGVRYRGGQWVCARRVVPAQMRQRHHHERRPNVLTVRCGFSNANKS